MLFVTMSTLCDPPPPLRVGAHLFVQQPQRVLDVRVLQGDGGSPLGEQEPEDQVHDAVEASSDQLEDKQRGSDTEQ